jgi:hypothetical protein
MSKEEMMSLYGRTPSATPEYPAQPCALRSLAWGPVPEGEPSMPDDSPRPLAPELRAKLLGSTPTDAPEFSREYHGEWIPRSPPPVSAAQRAADEAAHPMFHIAVLDLPDGLGRIAVTGSESVIGARLELGQPAGGLSTVWMVRASGATGYIGHMSDGRFHQSACVPPGWTFRELDLFGATRACTCAPGTADAQLIGGGLFRCDACAGQRRVHPLDEMVDGQRVRDLLTRDEMERREKMSRPGPYIPWMPDQRAAVSRWWSAQLRAKVAASDAERRARAPSVVVEMQDEP